MDDLKDKTEQAKQTFVDYTADKPFKSLGIALLTGLVLGFLLKR